MAVTVVSGFNPQGYLETGKTFLRTFDRYWPKEVDLVVYVEEEIPTPERGKQRNVLGIPGCREFIEAYQGDPRFTGKAEVPGWRKKDLQAGYSYRYDAVKFCRQLFIPDSCASVLPDADILVWLDADVVSYADVPNGLVDALIGDATLCYLGRRDGHSDLGFWAVRLNPSSRAFLKSLADCYRTGAIFKLQEWHSAYVFDHFVNQYKDCFKCKSLTSHTKGHVWFDCEIGRYTDHLKGKMRKQLGYSPERR